MRGSLIALHRILFARPSMSHFNHALVHLGMRGLGMFTFGPGVSGEEGLLSRFAKSWRNPIVLDVGANVGDYARKVVSRCDAPNLIAFEPHPGTFRALQKAATEAGFVAVNAACGAEKGRMKLYDYADAGGAEGSEHASLFRDVIESVHMGQSVSYDVDVTTIDAVVEELRLPAIHLLKIDTEGNELMVLRGCAQTIAQGKLDVVQFEFNEMNVVSRSFFRDFYAVLPGFEFFRVLPSGLLPLREYRAIDCEWFAYQNIVAIRADLVRRLSSASRSATSR